MDNGSHNHSVSSTVPLPPSETKRHWRLIPQLLRVASKVIMVLDEDGIIRYQTESTKRLLGYNDNELVGRSLVDLLHLHSKAAGRAAINRMTRNESKFEAWKLRFNTASGDTIWLEGMASNFLKDPRLGGIMVYWRELNA